MSVRELQNYLSDHGVTVSGHLKPALIDIASSVERMGLPVDPNFTKDDHEKSLERRLNIHDIQISDPFTMKTENNFVQSPPFGLYDIFNHLIYHSAEYDKQGLASYKSYDDYRLFVNGYVDTLKTVKLEDCGVHVYVGKVQPSMKSTTDEGKKFYDLWFILEGRGPNRGSVIEAFCKCKGGRDGGCKHIAAAMYSLEDLLNTRGEDSVTSGSCKWLRKPRVDTEPCEVKKLIITKDKIAPAVKAKKRPYQWLQSKEFDVRQNQKPATKEEIALFTSRMKDLTPESPIFPLLTKLYLTKDEPSTPAPSSTNTPSSNQDKQSLGIMAQKITELFHLHKTLNPNELLAYLKFTDEEINIVNQTTIDQWKCKEWYMHKQGFLSASKCKSYCTRQNTLEKEKLDGFCKLAKETVTIKANVPASTMLNGNSCNPRGWGLSNEENAREAYKNVQNHLHHNVQLQNCGFMISAAKPYMGASLDDVRSCACITGCQKVAVEYKCPWVHKDNDPKSAFLSKEIGGVMLNGKLCLQATCKYYYQVQMQMYVSQLSSCDFVVWTTKGIQCATVPYDAKFINGVILQPEKFWLGQVAPLLIVEFQSLTEEDLCPKSEEVTAKVSVDLCEDKSEENKSKNQCELIHDAEESEPVNPAIQINGVDVREHDLLSLTPGRMVNDVIATALLNEQVCQFPVVDCLFYSILCGEQEGAIVSNRQTRMVAAEKYFTKDHLAKDYVVIPVVRSLHWLLIVLTPWHILLMDSLTWDKAIRQSEFQYIVRYLNHLCTIEKIAKKHTKLSHHVLKVPRQQIDGNSCGIYISLFLKHFFEDLDEYESHPTHYVNENHQWFTCEHGEEYRRQIKRQWDMQFLLHTKFGK